MSGVIGMPAPAGLVHGMGKELVEPDWTPAHQRGTAPVLARYPQGRGRPAPAGSACARAGR